MPWLSQNASAGVTVIQSTIFARNVYNNRSVTAEIPVSTKVNASK